MRERRQGTVIFIGSMRSEAPSPFSSLYSASKAAIRSFAQCLRMEVEEYGIKVCVIAPIFIRTRLSQELLMRTGSPYAAAVDRVRASSGATDRRRRSRRGRRAHGPFDPARAQAAAALFLRAFRAPAGLSHPAPAAQRGRGHHGAKIQPQRLTEAGARRSR